MSGSEGDLSLCMAASISSSDLLLLPPLEPPLLGSPSPAPGNDSGKCIGLKLNLTRGEKGSAVGGRGGGGAADWDEEEVLQVFGLVLLMLLLLPSLLCRGRWYEVDEGEVEAKEDA